MFFGIKINPPFERLFNPNIPEEHTLDREDTLLSAPKGRMFNAKMNKYLVPLDLPTESLVRCSFNSSDFSVYQVEAVTSVKIIDNKIAPESWKFINKNGAAFTNKTILDNVSTYLGRMVYLNHEQVEEKSFGFILDAQVVKKVDDEAPFDTISIQLLIAIAKDSEAEKLLLKSGSLSFGSLSEASWCSECGFVSRSDDNVCEHMERVLSEGLYYNHIGEPVAMVLIDGCEFIEISVVDVPAYDGAIVHQYLDVPPNKIIEFDVPESVFEWDEHNGITHWSDKGLLNIH